MRLEVKKLTLIIGLVAFALSIFPPAFGQHHQLADQYNEVDMHVRRVGQYHISDPAVLADSLTQRFHKEDEKVRAIYAWVATNISYNTIGYKNGWTDTQNVPQLLHSRKALCSGFSLLFDYLCQCASIESEIIEGYAKGIGYTSGQKFKKPNHAWNAVKIEDTWHLLDATWAAGLTDTSFETAIELDRYFKVDPEVFIKTHLPEDPTWQLLPSKQTIEGFENGVPIPLHNMAMNGYAPADYEGMDDYDKELLMFKRSFDFHPANVDFVERLSFAYIYKAIGITEKLAQTDGLSLVEKAAEFEASFHLYMDSAWVLVGTLPQIRIQKGRQIIADEINYQKGVFYYELGVETFIKRNMARISDLEAVDRTNIYFRKAIEFFKNVPSTSIYRRTASEYLQQMKGFASRAPDN
jgi:hypothetical protein